jgi:iron-sulfur cluster repair protein YtfE (RIC family)
MDIFSVLHQDHENVSTIFKKFEAFKGKQGSAQTCEYLFKELDTELSLHAQVEEDIVYPVFEEKQETREIIEESLDEHKEIESLLSDLREMPPDDENLEEWMSQLEDLQERVEHHVQEEEGQLFPKAKKIISKAEAEQLGENVEATKEELRGKQDYQEAS